MHHQDVCYPIGLFQVDQDVTNSVPSIGPGVFNQFIKAYVLKVLPLLLQLRPWGHIDLLQLHKMYICGGGKWAPGLSEDECNIIQGLLYISMYSVICQVAVGYYYYRIMK